MNENSHLPTPQGAPDKKWPHNDQTFKWVHYQASGKSSQFPSENVNFSLSLSLTKSIVNFPDQLAKPPNFKKRNTWQWILLLLIFNLPSLPPAFKWLFVCFEQMWKQNFFEQMIENWNILNRCLKTNIFWTDVWKLECFEQMFEN